ncbi:MAG: hypothetical protein R3A46_03105 [Thermomicrobiales bacterium]
MTCDVIDGRDVDALIYERGVGAALAIDTLGNRRADFIWFGAE